MHFPMTRLRAAAGAAAAALGHHLSPKAMKTCSCRCGGCVRWWRRIRTLAQRVRGMHTRASPDSAPGPTAASALIQILPVSAHATAPGPRHPLMLQFRPSTKLREWSKLSIVMRRHAAGAAGFNEAGCRQSKHSTAQHGSAILALLKHGGIRVCLHAACWWGLLRCLGAVGMRLICGAAGTDGR